MGKENTQIISVLFTRYHSTFSNFVYWISGRGYTHASIAFDDKNEYFYSFNFRGFCEEDVNKIRKRSTKSVCFRIEVSDSSYEKMKEKLEGFKQQREQFGYCRIGVFLCVLLLCRSFMGELLD